MTDDSDWGVSISRTPNNDSFYYWLTLLTIAASLVVGFAILFTLLF